MDIFLTIVSLILLIVGLVGCIVPMLPGPPLSFVGLLLFNWTSYGDFSNKFIITWLAIVVLVTLLDYYLPILMTQRFGGSRYATIGAAIGLIAGFFILPPIGIVVCPFVGAFVGELINDSSDTSKALKVAFGSFAAFIVGTGAKLVVSIMLTVYVVKALVEVIF